MTTVANRHGLRKAAADNRDRHAQRTPLPPRAGAVQDAKDAIAATRPPAGSGLVSRNGKVEVVRYGQMTVPQLRDVAFRLGVAGHRSMSKGQLLTAILAKESEQPATVAEERRERRTQAKVAATLRSGRTDQTDRIDAAFATAGLEPRGVGKANRLAADAPGWSPEVSGEGDLVEILLTRGSETVRVSWTNGVFVYDGANYAMGDRNIKIRNVSHARQLMARTPEDAAADVQRVINNKAFRAKERPADEGPVRKMSFDPEALSDKDLIDQLLGKGINWLNRISGSAEAAYVGRDPRRIRITEFQGERIIHWCCPITGFRAARVSGLLRVGAKVDLRTREPAPDEKRGGRRRKQARQDED